MSRVKQAYQDLQEKAAHVLSYGHHKEHELSSTYNPKVVKAIGSVGKIAGGVVGMFAGHGLASAAGAVGGAKIGQAGLLKVFEKVVTKLPESVQEKLRAKQETINHIHEVEHATEKQMHRKEEIEATSKSLQEHLSRMTPEQQAKVRARLEASPQHASLFEKAQSAYTKYAEYFDTFEKNHPIAATSREFIVHAIIGPGLEAAHVGHGLIHTIELFAAGGGAEKLTAHLHNGINAARGALNRFAERFSGKKIVEPIAMAA
jgi:outer membrane lipoprotein SlyB